MAGYDGWRLAPADRFVREGQIVKVSHDPGDPQITSHCPFCGSGQIVGRSDGTIGCDFCGMNYIVRVQPAFPGMPQAPGMGGAPTDVGPEMMDPGMEGEVGPDGMPLDPGMEEGAEEGGFPPEDGEEEGFPPGDDEDAEDEEGGFPPAEEDGGDDAPAPKKKSKSDSKSKSKKGVLAAADPARAEYTRHYNRGWRASQGGGGGVSSPLERADSRGEPKAWYDGYLDDAVGREKFHSRDCPAANHDEDANCTSFTNPRPSSPPDWGKQGASYKTLAGDQLGEDAYIRHLAVLHSGGSPAVIAAIRAEAAR
jgi:hypothetical protein